jgi:pimeloyl-ACP methyl ester carboxylesterase
VRPSHVHHAFEQDRAIPQAFGEALDEADLFFQAEMSAVQQWSFGPGDAERVTQPVLNVLGAESASRFAERSELMQSWFPRAQRLSVPGAGHLLMVQNPVGLAQGLSDFFASQRSSETAMASAVAGVSAPDGRSGTS